MTMTEEQYMLEHNQVTMDSLIKGDADQEPVALLSVTEYASCTGVHKHTVLNWIKAGKVPYIPVKHGIYTRYAIPSDTIPPMFRPDRGGPLSDQSA